MRATLFVLGLTASCAAFSAPASRPAVVTRAGTSVVMGPKSSSLPKGWRRVASRSRPGQFSYENIKTGDRYDKLPRSAGGGAFYDDERDTVTQTPWSFLQAEKRDSSYASVTEESGFGEDGKDLALVGLAPYLAFIPFLLFFFSYVFGDNSGSGPYSNGNF